MIVYLDMDGVIADFFSEAVKLSDGPHASWRDMEYRDVEKVLNKIRYEEKEFFLKLHPFPGTRTLIQSIVNIAGEYSILSSPLNGYDKCHEEKIAWVEKHLHIDPDEIIITTDKTKYAAGNILIDDYGANCKAWEEAGGFSIKYQADEDRLSDVLLPLSMLYKKQP